MYLIPALIFAVILVLAYMALCRWVDRDHDRLDREDQQRRRPPTMPPRPTSAPAFGTTAGREHQLRLLDQAMPSSVRHSMLRAILVNPEFTEAERLRASRSALLWDVKASTGDLNLDDILNVPEPNPATMGARDLARAFGVPASMLRSGNPDWPYPPREPDAYWKERRACRPPLDHSSDADPLVPPEALE